MPSGHRQRIAWIKQDSPPPRIYLRLMSNWRASALANQSRASWRASTCRHANSFSSAVSSAASFASAVAAMNRSAGSPCKFVKPTARVAICPVTGNSIRPACSRESRQRDNGEGSTILPVASSIPISQNVMAETATATADQRRSINARAFLPNLRSSRSTQIRTCVSSTIT